MNFEETEFTLKYLTDLLSRIKAKQTKYNTTVSLLQLNGYGDYGPEVDQLQEDIDKLTKIFDTVKRYL